jgi:DNA invertase Pin-like site-specific DNA recombinase
LSGKALFQIMLVFADFERAMIPQRVLAGLARVKEQGESLGRRCLEDSDTAKVAAVQAALAAKQGIRRIAPALQIGLDGAADQGRTDCVTDCRSRYPLSIPAS